MSDKVKVPFTSLGDDLANGNFPLGPKQSTKGQAATVSRPTMVTPTRGSHSSASTELTQHMQSLESISPLTSTPPQSHTAGRSRIAKGIKNAEKLSKPLNFDFSTPPPKSRPSVLDEKTQEHFQHLNAACSSPGTPCSSPAASTLGINEGSPTVLTPRTSPSRASDSPSSTMGNESRSPVRSTPLRSSVNLLQERKLTVGEEPHLSVTNEATVPKAVSKLSFAGMEASAKPASAVRQLDMSKNKKAKECRSISVKSKRSKCETKVNDLAKGSAAKDQCEEKHKTEELAVSGKVSENQQEKVKSNENVPPPPPPPVENLESTLKASFFVGQVVSVASRTWPGINKPGGMARITKIHPMKPMQPVKYNVVYILGGSERNVDEQYIETTSFDNKGRAPKQRDFFADYVPIGNISVSKLRPGVNESSEPRATDKKSGSSVSSVDERRKRHAHKRRAKPAISSSSKPVLESSVRSSSTRHRAVPSGGAKHLSGSKQNSHAKQTSRDFGNPGAHDKQTNNDTRKVKVVAKKLKVSFKLYEDETELNEEEAQGMEVKKKGRSKLTEMTSKEKTTKTLNIVKRKHTEITSTENSAKVLNTELPRKIKLKKLNPEAQSAKSSKKLNPEAQSAKSSKKLNPEAQRTKSSKKLNPEAQGTKELQKNGHKQRMKNRKAQVPVFTEESFDEETVNSKVLEWLTEDECGSLVELERILGKRCDTLDNPERKLFDLFRTQKEERRSVANRFMKDYRRLQRNFGVQVGRSSSVARTRGTEIGSNFLSLCKSVKPGWSPLTVCVRDQGASLPSPHSHRALCSKFHKVWNQLMLTHNAESHALYSQHAADLWVMARLNRIEIEDAGLWSLLPQVCELIPKLVPDFEMDLNTV